MKNIKIIGCGWLGSPLATHLVKEGHSVSGSTTSRDKLDLLKQEGIDPHLVNLPHDIDPDFFIDAEVIIIDIPPQTRANGPDFHLECIQKLLPFIHAHHRVIYVSATSVYPQTDKMIDEQILVDKDSKRAKALFQAEEFLHNNLDDRLTILRMGGLLGYDRIPGKYSSGKEVDSGLEKVNYIHRDDAIGVIMTIIDKELYGETFNVVAPKHPAKKEVYLKNSVDFNFEPPVFIENKEQLKKRYISNHKLVEFTDYTYLYPDPLHFYYTK